MNEPSAIYSLNNIILDKSIGTTQNVILYQGMSALSAVVVKISSLIRICGPRNENRVFVNPSIPMMLQDICTHAGLASQTLFNGSNRQSNFESDVSYKLRLERFKYVKDKCDKKGFIPNILTDREIRNSLLHIDEKLADILTEKDGIGWMIDEVSSSRGVYDRHPEIEEVKYCRSYIHNEGKIVHLNHEMDVLGLKTECETALKVIFGIEVMID